MNLKNMCHSILWTLFEYNTPRIFTIRSFAAGVLNRVLQLSIIAYIIGYVIIYKKGYQISGLGQSTVTTKVKGVVSTQNRPELEEQYRKVWDVVEYVIPAQMNDAVFVMTNAIITPQQKEAVCPENPSVSPTVICKNETVKDICKAGLPTENGNGIMTGKCVKFNEYVSTCQIAAWCPVETDPKHIQDRRPLLPESANFTVLIKNFVEFSTFGAQYKRRNIIEQVNNTTYLKTCTYDETNDPYCPVFKLGYIISQTGNDFYESALEGAIISMTIKWDCNLDWDLSNCKPIYELTRLDSKNATIAPGWNFRFSKEYRLNSSAKNATIYRDLYKVYGLLFVFKVQAIAGKFNAVPLGLSIGSGLALLGIATILCDIMVLYISKSKNVYKTNKYLTLVDEKFAEVLGGSESTENISEVINE